MLLILVQRFIYGNYINYLYEKERYRYIVTQQRASSSGSLRVE
jgi:hypothetical protein